VGYKRLEKGRFVWPSVTRLDAGGHPKGHAGYSISISAAQLAYMLDGIDWRNPVHTFRPERAG